MWTRSTTMKKKKYKVDRIPSFDPNFLSSSLKEVLSLPYPFSWHHFFGSSSTLHSIFPSFVYHYSCISFLVFYSFTSNIGIESEKYTFIWFVYIKSTTRFNGHHGCRGSTIGRSCWTFWRRKRSPFDMWIWRWWVQLIHSFSFQTQNLHFVPFTIQTQNPFLQISPIFRESWFCTSLANIYHWYQLQIDTF